MTTVYLLSFSWWFTHKRTKCSNTNKTCQEVRRQQQHNKRGREGGGEREWGGRDETESRSMTRVYLLSFS